jgi:DNA topoisomerase-1
MSTKAKRGGRKKSDAVWRRGGTPETGFTYLRAGGRPLKLPSALKRIKALVIPPAWTGVEIAADPNAKVQVTGFDAAGRKQYRYHPEVTSRRARRKYRKLLEFARALPRLREETDRHLRRPGPGREKVLATIVRLMMRGFFRVGSERYAVENKTFGIATLRKRHLRLEGNDLYFRYVGKRSIHHHHVVADTPLVEVLREIMELPGPRLFRYLDEEGRVRNVSAADVNAYVKRVAGEKYTSKDIRTWGGTVRAATILSDLGPPRNPTEAKKNLVLACKLVAAELGNTPAVCRSAYIHPVVLEKYQAGRTIAPFMREAPRPPEAGAPAQYYPEEAALMRFLERWG